MESNDNLGELLVFLRGLSALDLAKMRHEAIQLGDDDLKRIIDEEFKARDKR